MHPRILVVDDEPAITKVVVAYLRRDGYEAVTADNGERAWELLTESPPDLLILDLMLPGISGLELCRRIRETPELMRLPCILLTARGEEADRVVGLRMGADDYVVKPFSPSELVARVEALLRRTGWDRNEGQIAGDGAGRVLVRGPLRINEERFQATIDGKPLDLTPTEFRMLAILAGHPGRVYTRSQLVELAQGETYEGYERNVDTHIKNLRKKLGDTSTKARFIQTVYGVGYRFATEIET